MGLYEKLDLGVVLIANWINIVLTLIFLNRVWGQKAWEHPLGYGTVIMILPLVVIAGYNLVGHRSWAYWVLPLLMVAYLTFEFVLDYVLKTNFRQTRLLGPYLLVFYLALFAMIGYAFLAGRKYGFITLITYFICLAATAFSYSKVGHGS